MVTARDQTLDNGVKTLGQVGTDRGGNSQSLTRLLGSDQRRRSISLKWSLLVSLVKLSFFQIVSGRLFIVQLAKPNKMATLIIERCID